MLPKNNGKNHAKFASIMSSPENIVLSSQERHIALERNRKALEPSRGVPAPLVFGSRNCSSYTVQESITYVLDKLYRIGNTYSAHAHLMQIACLSAHLTERIFLCYYVK